jgi:hypothetical protein
MVSRWSLFSREARVVKILEELKAAKTAKAAVDVLSTPTRKSEVSGKLRKANHAAVLNLSSGGALNEVRGDVGIALSNLMDEHGQPTPMKIDKAKRAIEAWIGELEAAKV